MHKLVKQMETKKLPLMPKATAVWLVENSSLTFKQIADFCGIHELEVQNIADGEIAQGIVGLDPITNGQITRSDLQESEKDQGLPLKLLDKYLKSISILKPANKKYTPLARRRDKPDGILWLLKNCPEMKDIEISKLIGTTKSMIESIRNGEYWNLTNMRPRDPVLLGLCTQIDLDRTIEKAKHRQ
jgi:hypothetical protein